MSASERGWVDDSDRIWCHGEMSTAAIRVKAGGLGKVRRWDVVVTNPDGTSTLLADGLVVEP